MTLATILVVDDRPASRYTVVHALKRAGYDVTEAETGTEALELATQIPSAILLDVKLPDILGYEVCRRLKANPRTSHIPVLRKLSSLPGFSWQTGLSHWRVGECLPPTQ